MNNLLIAIEKLWLNTKLLLGFSIGLVVAAAIGYQSLDNLAVLEAEMGQLYELELLGIAHFQEANINQIYMGRAVRQMILAQDDRTRDQARAQVAAAREALHNEMAEGRKRIIRAEAVARYEQFQRNFAKYNENIEHALAMIEREKANPSAAAKFITGPEFAAAGAAADDDLTELTKIKAKGSRAKVEEVRAQARATRQFALLLLGAGLILSIGFGVVIGNSIKRPNERLRASVEGLAGGDVASPIPHTDYPNEIGIMARAIRVLQGIYGKAEDTRWIKTHTAEIGAALQQADNFKGLAQTAISRIAPAVGAGHGAFYVSDGERHLNLLGSYGYRERKSLNSRFLIGEGLVGQAAMEKASITLTAPRDYIQISSGLGEAPPACVAVLPIVHQDRVLGVLEIASFQQLTEREVALLDALMPVLATTMEIMDRNQRTRELLAATQAQAERMEKQAAQLEEQTVEMEAQQAELMETENWFRGIIETSPEGLLVVEESGAIVLSNPKAETLFGHGAGEMIGLNVDRLLPEERRASFGAKHQLLLAENRSERIGDDGDVSVLRQDGSAFPARLVLSPLPMRGSRGRCLSISVRALSV